MVSEGQIETVTFGLESVLILVLMEHGLGVLLNLMKMLILRS